MPDRVWRTGLVLGKFMPFHRGHLALIRFAAARCERLVVLVCTQDWEPVDGKLRLHWVRTCLAGEPTVEVRHCTDELPYTGLQSREISRIWGEHLVAQLPEVEVVFTSEEYGNELTEVMRVDHVQFDRERRLVPVSASEIRRDPLAHWDHLPEVVRPHYVRRVCLFGPESVGKSTLAAQLAHCFGTVYVPEAARELIPDSRGCRFEDLLPVAEAHAREIERCLPLADKILFCDTDLMTTRIYARFMFDRDLEVEPWVEAANRFDLHLLCESDLPYDQDGTRLGVAAQAALRRAFWSALEGSGFPFEVIHGSNLDRLDRAVEAVKRRLLPAW